MKDQDEAERRPRRQDVIDRAVRAALGRMPKALPARVTAYNASQQRVDCKVLVQQPFVDEEDARQVESVPVVPSVPVVFPGAGGFRFTCPISDGNLIINAQVVPATTGLLIWCERSIDKWLSGNGQEVDPEFDHEHALTDAVFVPGLNPFGAALSSAPTDHATIGADAGAQIHFHNGSIVVGDEAAAQKMLKAETLVQDLTSAVTTLNTILLAGTTGGPTAQILTQAAQWALTDLFTKLSAGGIAYLSTEAKNA